MGRSERVQLLRYVGGASFCNLRPLTSQGDRQAEDRRRLEEARPEGRKEGRKEGKKEGRKEEGDIPKVCDDHQIFRPPSCDPVYPSILRPPSFVVSLTFPPSSTHHFTSPSSNNEFGHILSRIKISRSKPRNFRIGGLVAKQDHLEILLRADTPRFAVRHKVTQDRRRSRPRATTGGESRYLHRRT